MSSTRQRLRRLQPALEAAQKQENQAACDCAQLQTELLSQEAQVKQLLGYREEYITQHQREAGEGLPAYKFREHALFLQQLDHSIEQVQQRLEQLHHSYQVRQAQWLQHRTQTQGLDTMLKDYQQAQADAEERHAQAETDEYASYSHWKSKQQ